MPQIFCERKYLILRSKREAVEQELGMKRSRMNDDVAVAPADAPTSAAELEEPSHIDPVTDADLRETQPRADRRPPRSQAGSSDSVRSRLL